MEEEPSVKSPYQLLPTESLRFTPPKKMKQKKQELRTITTTTPTEFISNLSSSVKSRNDFVTRELDDESGKRILEYIYDEMHGSLMTKNRREERKKKKTNPSKASLAKDGHKNTFYIPESKRNTNKSTASSLNILDYVSDSLGLKTTSNIQKIDKSSLRKNGMTIEILIEDCEVSLSNLRLAGILNSFEDLLELDFRPMDLTRNRELFNCNSLKTLFNANHDTMEKYGIPLGIDDIMLGKFYVSELQTLDFKLDRMVLERGIGKSQLHALNFPLEDLISLGLTREHLKILNISRRQALMPMPEGFGWKEEIYKRL